MIYSSREIVIIKSNQQNNMKLRPDTPPWGRNRETPLHHSYFGSKES